MTRDERKAKARELIANGATYASAGQEVGVAPNTAWYWLHPEAVQADNAARHKYKLAWSRENNRAQCPCGSLAGIGSRLSWQHQGLCQACRRDVRTVGRAWRCQEIYEMWHEGFTLLGIALELDSTVGSINVEIVRMRQEGWDMPYRRQPRKARAA